MLCDGIIFMMLLIIIGFFFFIIGNFLILGYVEFMVKMFGSFWFEKLVYLVDVIFEIMGFVVVFGIVYWFVEKYGVDVLLVGVILFVVFLLVILY